MNLRPSRLRSYRFVSGTRRGPLAFGWGVDRAQCRTSIRLSGIARRFLGRVASRTARNCFRFSWSGFYLLRVVSMRPRTKNQDVLVRLQREPRSIKESGGLRFFPDPFIFKARDVARRQNYTKWNLSGQHYGRILLRDPLVLRPQRIKWND
jgi:hypothetical protein